MRLLAIILSTLVALVAPVSAQMNFLGQDAVPLGYCQLTLTGTAAKLSSCTNGVPTGALYAYIEVETANARYRDDGVAPTTSVGMLLQSNALAGIWYMAAPGNLSFIAVTGSPVLDVLFYR